MFELFFEKYAGASVPWKKYNAVFCISSKYSNGDGKRFAGAVWDGKKQLCNVPICNVFLLPV